MSYKTQAGLADDEGLRRRVIACAALEQVPNPEGWAYEQRWKLSAQPGWDKEYSDALARGVKNPGDDDTVVTDAMILAAVKTLTAPAGG